MQRTLRTVSVVGAIAAVSFGLTACAGGGAAPQQPEQSPTVSAPAMPDIDDRPLYTDTLITNDTDYEATRRLSAELDAAIADGAPVTLSLLFLRMGAASGDVNHLTEGTSITLLTKDGHVSVLADTDTVELLDDGTWLRVEGRFDVVLDEIEGAGTTYVLTTLGGLPDDVAVPDGDDDRCTSPTLEADAMEWAMALAEFDVFDPVELYDGAVDEWGDSPRVWGAVKATALEYRNSGFQTTGDYIAQVCGESWG